MREYAVSKFVIDPTYLESFQKGVTRPCHGDMIAQNLAAIAERLEALVNAVDDLTQATRINPEVLPVCVHDTDSKDTGDGAKPDVNATIGRAINNMGGIDGQIQGRPLLGFHS